MTRAARSGVHGHFIAFPALVVLVIPGLGISSLGWSRVARAAEGSPPRSKETRSTPGGEESLNERRAVRGSPVDDGPESPELNEVRHFEEQTFPRVGSGFGASGAGDSDSPEEAPPGLPGRWEGSGDVPEALRSSDSGADVVPVHPVPDSAWLRGLKLPEIPVRWDPAVLRYLEYFRNNPRGRAVMSAWIRRSGRYRTLIESALVREGLPKDLLYVAMVESGFDTAARSRVGAGGIWQFMPGAARAYGLEVGYWVDARRDPERSAEAAARYLKDLFVRFGSWHLVFAAYNAGYGAVLKSITRYNTNDYWELCRHEAGLPWESSLYVPKILAAAIVGHNVEAFGFTDVVPDPPFSFERVEVSGGTTMATVARASQCPPETIASLNPQLTRDRAPPDRGSTSVRVPVGARAGFAESFARERDANDQLDAVTLRFGETLEAVAKSRGTTARELRRLNGLNGRDSSELRAGVPIMVPRRKGMGRPRDDQARSLDAKNDAAGGDGVSDGPAGSGVKPSDPEDEILVAVPDRVFNYDGRERVFYRTRDADTLEEVAGAFGVQVDDLVAWNNLDSTAKLHPNMVMQIFVRKDFDPRDVVVLDSAHVRVVTLGSDEFLELEAARRGKRRLVVEVRAGDTLVKMGRRYGLTVGDLARINRFSYNTELKGGQKIVVYSPTGMPTREMAHGMTAEGRRERIAAGPRLGNASSKVTPRVADRANRSASSDAGRGGVQPGSGAHSRGLAEKTQQTRNSGKHAPRQASRQASKKPGSGTGAGRKPK